MLFARLFFWTLTWVKFIPEISLTAEHPHMRNLTRCPRFDTHMVVSSQIFERYCQFWVIGVQLLVVKTKWRYLIPWFFRLISGASDPIILLHKRLIAKLSGSTSAPSIFNLWRTIPEFTSLKRRPPALLRVAPLRFLNNSASNHINMFGMQILLSWWN